MAFEEAHEVLRVLKACLERHLLDGQFGVAQLSLGILKEVECDMLLCCFACFGFDHIAEVVGREVHLVGKVLDGWDTFGSRFAGEYIIVEQLVEACKGRDIEVLSGNELPLVEAHAVVEQEFKIGDDQSARVLIDRVLEFDIDDMHTVAHHLYLVLGEVECLVAGIGEERVLFHLLGEGCAMEEIGVEENTDSVFGYTRYGSTFDHLLGCHTDDRFAIEVVLGLPVVDDAAFGLFEKKGVETVGMLAEDACG